MVAFSLRFRPACGKTVADGMDFAVSDINRKKHVTLNINNVMTHKMPELPYAKDALEPHISRETIEYHYGKHLQAYVDNLNKLIPGTEYEDVSLEEIIRRAEGPIFNNGAQVWNHTFYFNTFSPKPQEKLEGKLLDALEKKYGSFDNFKAEFEKKATGLFGSGWTWLVKDASGALDIVNESNAGNPIRNGRTPLMVMDVWEHAYYIDYRNRRADSVKATWHVIDWKKVGERF